MKKLLIITSIILSVCGARAEETLRLKCLDIQEDVIVVLLDDGATLQIGDKKYDLVQEFEAPVVYYRFDPWYNFQIGNKQFLPSKYSLGFSNEDGYAQYVGCKQIDM